MKQLFYIKSEEAKIAQPVLLIRVGEKHFSFAITDAASQQLESLYYYTTEEVNEFFLNELTVAHPELNDSFFQVLIGYDYPQNTLVPLKQYKQEDANLLLNALHGVNGPATIITELIAEWQVYTIYAIPKEVQEWMIQQFSMAKYWHQTTIGIKNISAADDGLMQVDFRKDDFTILVTANNKLLLAQTIDYSTPEDVIYSLLKISQQLDLSQQEVHIALSGLIDQQSALYRELYQYFSHIEFRDVTWMIPASANNESPAHFFTSLNDLAKCAS